jgi:LysR family transcriptional regulator, glycine cleavage system transcriptional activator
MARTHARLPLNALRVFATVAERRSFSAAAEALNLSTAAVSMQVKVLEEYLQVRLLTRSSQHVELTAEGERLVPFVERGLNELEQGFRLARAERNGGVLVVSMLTSFLHRWLLPRLPDFLTNHPEIDLRLQCTQALTDFARSEVHVAIRMGRGQWQGLHAERLYEEWLAPVCAPALLERHGPLDGPGSTGSYPLLHSTSEPWEMWTRGVRYESWDERWPERGAAFDDSVAILSAAAQGQGLVLSRWSLAAEFLASGQLVSACDCAIPYGYDCYFVCPPAHLEMRKVQVLREWLLKNASEALRPKRIVDVAGTAPSATTSRRNRR